MNRWLATFGACYLTLQQASIAFATIPTSPAPASPDGSKAADLLNQARSHYQRGVEAYRQGRYREAIDSFTKADVLVPSAALSFNVARAYEKLHDRSNAVIWYRDYLQRAGYISDRSDIERHVTALEQSLRSTGLQRLSVFSEPDGAVLTLDGKDVGTSPWSGVIPPGMHEVTLRLRGYMDISQSVWVNPDAALDVRFSLSRRFVEIPAGSIALRDAREPREPRPDRVATHSSGTPALMTWGYVAAGAGLAAVSGGVVFEILRRQSENEARNDTRQVSFADKYDTMQRQQTAARILFGSGAALLATGGVLLYIGSRNTERKTTVSVACLPASCKATLRGSF